MSTQANIILNKICQEAASKKASEIYLLPAQIPFIRSEGHVRALEKENILSTSFIQALITSLLTEEQVNELKQEKQVLVIKEISKFGPSQINVYYQKDAPAVRIKLLSQQIADLSKLGLPEMVKNLSKFRRGVVFITGPRDSGRSTLAMSFLNDINKRESKFIATLEKPIESTIPGVKSIVEQREVGRDVNSFLHGLKYIRTRNADVVMISTIESADVMNELFAIAEAGSLVFAIMDTESVIKTVKRILHFFPVSEEENIRYFLSENLAGVISSRLVPRIGGGRIPALEILPGTQAVKSLIAGGKLHQLAGALQATEDQTAISLDQYLADLVTSGKVMSEHAFKHCIDPEVLKTLLSR